MLQEPFAVGRSAVHRLDPRVRLLSAAGFSCGAAVVNGPAALAAALALAVIWAAAARLPVGAVLRRLAAVNGLIALIWVVLPFTVPGEALVRLGPLGASAAGLGLALRITLKSNAIVLAFIALVATMPVATAGHALHRLRVPDKIVHLLLMTYRYLFVLEQEYLRLARAAKIRGFRPRTDRHTYRTYAYLVGMLCVRALERAERVRWAMLCRGFERRFVSLREFEAGRGSLVFLAASAAAVAGILFLESARLSFLDAGAMIGP